MPPYQTSDLSQLGAGINDAELSSTVTQLTELLKDADYLRYPIRHTSPNVPHDVISQATMMSSVDLTTQLLRRCQQLVRQQ